MGDKVRQLQRWPHGQQQAAKILLQEYGQGAAGMPQEHQGWVKRPQGRPQARQEWAWVAIEPQEMRAVAQAPEAKVGGAANPLPWVAEPPQPWAGSPDPPTSACAHPAHAPKPSSWLRINSLAASITTSKVAASLPWWASSAAFSSAWSRQASSSSVLAGGDYSACLAGALPRALELTPGPATWSS